VFTTSLETSSRILQQGIIVKWENKSVPENQPANHDLIQPSATQGDIKIPVSLHQ